ncbi:arylesterase [Photobacterium jeanii]|uniref:Arylesterase n=1 Tax=Photobacterium jeanii TaxID=858640 RepID=A0A178KPJ7_9GAMM|nr:multifunctional acyl-CoA thioesterase I/protease I/lysophospholipase L1 [Photobacterium jeanii]OAN18684.1 arylesterase [Photobacterium jeanii]PST91636.1 multifunctional acyl-CoA thioesterase I/protease I/lysophospholipase L1 [Photobacterium jeanii]
MKRFLSILVFVLALPLVPLSGYCGTLLVLGDSLSAGYNMRAEQSWPILLEPILRQQGHDLDVVNASISGDTTGNGLARLPKLLQQHQPDYVLIELGANDGLRGFPPKTIRQNLATMIEDIQANNAQAMLMQIRVPPNYGKRYSQLFSALYPQLSKEYDSPLLPFFLEEVILKQEWMMNDGLHPKAEAQPWIAEFMAEEIGKVLEDK